MFDPEFYMGAYETVDLSTKAKVSAALSSPVQPICRSTAASGVQCMFFAFDNVLHIIILSPSYFTV